MLVCFPFDIKDIKKDACVFVFTLETIFTMLSTSADDMVSLYGVI